MIVLWTSKLATGMENRWDSGEILKAEFWQCTDYFAVEVREKEKSGTVAMG